MSTTSLDTTYHESGAIEINYRSVKRTTSSGRLTPNRVWYIWRSC